ncbi:hypothetical protein [Paucibacter sp. M5-1]|uniref:hypothetical protein n=1 Tax=Paucibacter sp. M5-1 TaxID=3015998 RepID=UPI003F821430
MRLPSIAARSLSLMAALCLLACGGGGGADGDSGTTPAADLVLSGVAAVGAPLGGARISVVDAKGASVGSAVAHPVEGTYRLTLSTQSPAMPLLLQARGMDAAGQPQVLHGTVQTAAATMTAQLTPLSDAAVALALGTDPRPVFAKAADNAALLASLGKAGAAADFLKTIVKTQLTELKISDAAALNLLGDAGFAAVKSNSQDLLIESLRISLVTNSKGVEQLQLGNKLLINQPVEVLVDLATAKTELAKSADAAPANAISSTLKATTGAAKVLPELATLDELGAALNKLIAQGASAATFAASELLVGYEGHNGRTLAELSALLASYAQKNWQFGRFQLMGCADDVAVTAGCNRVLVAAPISDSSGSTVALFSDALSLTKPKWLLKGNGKKLEFSLLPVSWLGLEASGALSSALSGVVAPASNPSLGVQLLLQGQDSAGTALLDKATVQTPGGFSIPLAYCGQRWLCISAAAGATSAVASGALSDTLLQPTSLGWLGGADTLRAARYLASYTLAGTAETRNSWLRAELPASVPAAARHPALDGVSASAPLSAAALASGLALNWSSWASANPDLRLSGVRALIRYSGSVTISDFTPAFPPASTLSLPALSAQAGQTPLAYELWLTAQDGAGRRLVTRYTLQP